MTSAPATRTPRRRLRRVLRALGAFTLGTSLALLTVEAGLRFALFSDSPTIRDATRKLRDPALWGNATDDPVYWKLAYLRQPADRRPKSAPHPDLRVGWRSGQVLADFSHKSLAELDRRRPVVLYGDSFAHCLTSRDDCFEGLFRSSDLDADYALLNYGTGGYGLDQSYLTLLESIDHYAELDPIVILSLLVDDDMNRMLLDFRERPKPTLHFDGDRLEARRPSAVDSERYLDEHPPAVLSWTWRLLVFGTDLVPRRYRHEYLKAQEKRRLARAVFERTKAELDRRGIEWFVLLFHSRRPALARKPMGWEEPFLLTTLAKLEIPYVSTRPDLWTVALENGGKLDTLYLQSGERGAGHLNALGNQAALRTIRRGMRGEFDPYEFQRGPRPAPVRSK